MAGKTEDKRNDYISWCEFFMSVAIVASLRSKDPSTQVGACIVNNNKIISTGYNGFPNGCSDDQFPWGKDDDLLKSKYAYVCHAEMNAVINSKCDLSGSTIFTTLFPCNECSKIIIQSGIKKVIYLSDKHYDRKTSKASRIMLDKAGVKFRQFKTDRRYLMLNLQGGK